MIRLTIRDTGDAWYVNPDHIVDIVNQKLGDNSSLVTTTKDELTVVETPEEVVHKVLEWKYIMQKGAYTNTQEMARLRELAGLEEQA